MLAEKSLGRREEYERFPRPADPEGITRKRIPKLWCNRPAWQLAPEGALYARRGTEDGASPSNLGGWHAEDACRCGPHDRREWLGREVEIKYPAASRPKEYRGFLLGHGVWLTQTLLPLSGRQCRPVVTAAPQAAEHPQWSVQFRTRFRCQK